MNRRITCRTKLAGCFFATGFLLMALHSFSQELYPVRLPNGVWHDQQRELRYRPDGKDFVIVNGTRLFTRAIYGTNTAFRVEAGDRPEFALYMPGMGGNFKFGIEAAGKSKWLTQAEKITARYRPGAMIYTIEDPLLQGAKLQLEILAMADAEGLVIKTNLEGVSQPVNMYWVFGGASAKKFSRDGDMGPDPESSFYLKPENCKDNLFTITSPGKFNLKYGSGLQAGGDGRYFVEDLNQTAKPAPERSLSGIFNPAADLKITDAVALRSPVSLYNSKTDKAPVISGRLTVNTNRPHYFAILNPATKMAMDYTALPAVFQQADSARMALSNRITINTPDPYVNTIGGALATAANAIWEAPTFLHGAIGWRMRLNGWRGPYAGDALGWHERSKMHFGSYALSQLTGPATGAVTADTANHLSRSLEKLGVGMFTEGYISRDPGGASLRAHHYDMNMPFIDELLRHYQWTGDTAFMKQNWLVLKRHLNWETRNFDADGNGLYDAYAAIWASDALQYSGGDVTHTSAYNYLAFKKAAQIASIIGEDATPYQKQAGKIKNAMDSLLWMPASGHYAEFKDALGNKLLHPSAALWTIYHSIDSEVPDKFQAYQSLRYIDNEIPHIPVKAKGLDDGGYYTLATTNWMPYQWSLNNVALAESMHTALANWQGGRTDEAFRLFKSEVLASMYLGGSPGNIVQISHYDAVRGEAYRDFGDPVGMFSRALVEGLFGIVPDALNNVLAIRPGLPSGWNYASFSTPDISFDFKRLNNTDNYRLIPTLPAQLSLRFQVIARGQVKSVTINGKPVQWKNLDDAIGKPVIEISAAFAQQYNIRITWEGNKPVLPSVEKNYAAGSLVNVNIPGVKILAIFDPAHAFQDLKNTSNSVLGHVTTAEGNYTVFVRSTQGKLSWWIPLCFKVVSPFTLTPEKSREGDNNTFRIQNNTTKDISGTIIVNAYQTTVHIAAGRSSTTITVPENELYTGTNPVSIVLPEGKTLVGDLINWKATKPSKMETVDLSNYFNDKVTQIFKNKYLTPRPQTTTLQLPWQGIGDWPHPMEKFEVDDGGLRRLAAEKNMISLPQGIPFNTPGDSTKNNIVFTSQWDNYPKEKSIALTGKASHAWFLMAGSTNPMQSQMSNGELLVDYTDGSRDTLVLRNPETWWPIDQDYYTDGYAFALSKARPIRVHLATGEIVPGDLSKQKYNGKPVKGGAATVLDMPLDASKTLKSITLKTITNDVVIGLMSITLARE